MKEIKVKKPTLEVVDKLIDGTPEERYFICEHEFMYFCMYYFGEFFTHKLAPFHLLAYQVLKFEKYKYYILEWFRESGKRQPLDAKVLTPGGFKLFGDLELGGGR